MSTTLARELVAWSARLAENEAHRVALRAADLRRQLEELRHAADAPPARDPAEIEAAARGVEAENATLEAEARELERQVVQHQRVRVDGEIARRDALLSQARSVAATEQQRGLLAALAGVEKLLGGRSDPDQIWNPDGGAAWQWDSLPPLAEAQVRSSIDDGLLREVRDAMLARIQALDHEVGVLPERLAALADLQTIESALEARLATLLAMVGKDSTRTFRDPSLLSYYASDEGLSPQQTHALIESRLHGLCQDIVMEAAVWRIQDRPEVARLADPPAR